MLSNREPLVEMQTLDPLATPPNWNASKHGVGGYWEWNPDEDRGENRKGAWAWYDNPEELAALAQTQKQKTKSYDKLAFTPVDLWIIGGALIGTGIVIGIILIGIVKG
jgi:hypothetical protein